MTERREVDISRGIGIGFSIGQLQIKILQKSERQQLLLKLSDYRWIRG